jgi:filamentous hemagglutinin
VPSKTAVQELEVEAYKNLKAREVVGDGLEHDHIPSFAALRTAKEGIPQGQTTVFNSFCELDF